MELPFADRRAFDAWLEKHHEEPDGVWIVFAKKGVDVPSVKYAEAVEVALIWGWIDGQKKARDERFWLQRFCPRSKKSLWSKINRDKATALIRAGKMQPSGLREVERAKADGRWDAAYDSPSRAAVPPELAAALAGSARAAAAFAALDGANRYAVVWRVATAKKAETRVRLAGELAAMLARGETLHPRQKRATKKTPAKKATRRR
jgi:uncharacterized protein YdeI (YjbR/CyaY-like superfamily)